MVTAAVETFLRDWPYLTALIALGTVGVVAGPSLLTAMGRARRLSAVERRALADFGVPLDSVRVVTRPRGVPTAFAVGVVPGHRYVCVTEHLVELLTPAELAGVVGHELGHLRRYHVLPRLGVPTLFVVVWAAAVSAELTGAFLGGLALVAPVTLASFATSRWTEYDADAYVARHADGIALADALDQLTYAGYLSGGESGLRRLIARHPTPRERVERLRATTPTRRGHRNRDIAENNSQK